MEPNTETNKQAEEAKATPKTAPESKSDNSTLCGVTIRGWIAIIVVLTVCGMSIGKIDIKEPLYTLAGLIVGFYFGQNPKKGA